MKLEVGQVDAFDLFWVRVASTERGQGRHPNIMRLSCVWHTVRRRRGSALPDDCCCFYNATDRLAAQCVQVLTVCRVFKTLCLSRSSVCIVSIDQCAVMMRDA